MIKSSQANENFTIHSNCAVPLSSFIMVGFCLGTWFFRKNKMFWSVLCSWVWLCMISLVSGMQGSALWGSFWETLFGGSRCQLFTCLSLDLFLHPAAWTVRRDDKAVIWKSLHP